MNSQITPQPPPGGVWGSAAAAWLALDPMTKSAITSVLLVGASWVTAWGAAHGLIPAADVSAITNDIVAAVGVALMALFAIVKMRAQSQSAMIQAINSDKTNGVKVVPETSPTPPVNAPVKP